MCGDDIGVAWGLFQDVLQHLLFSVDIQGTGGFIHEHYGCLAQKRTGNCYALGLAFGQTLASFVDAVINALGHFFDKIPGTGKLQGSDNIFVCSILSGKTHVLGDGSAEQSIALGDIGNQSPALCAYRKGSTAF